MKSKILTIFLVGLLILIIAIYIFSSLSKEQTINQSISSGIKGLVMMGPICPVQRVGDDTCNDKVTEANIVVKNKKEDVIKNTETMEDGSFSVELSPGQYVIYTNSVNKSLGGTKPEYVTVEDGKFSNVTIRIDTGIR